METKDKIIQFMRLKGPVLPSDVSSHIGSTILLTSAYLSELASEGKVKITNMKVGGGSPLYYIPGHESRLVDFSRHLNEKNQKAFEHIKEHKILRDSELSPLMRVALREIKDFARPLEVQANDTKEIFWKWYLLEGTEAERQIKSRLGIEQPKEEPIPIEKPALQKESRPINTPQALPQQKPVDKIIDIPGRIPEKEQELEKPEKTIEEKEVIPIQEPIKKEPKEPNQEKQEKAEKQEQLIESNNTNDGIDIWNEATSPFIDKIKRFFSHKGIEIIEVEIKRKDSDIELVINVATTLGKMIYFCKAKSKKKINDGDISSAFVEGQMKKLPVILLILGDMTKKAELMLDNELRGITVVKIE